MYKEHPERKLQKSHSEKHTSEKMLTKIQVNKNWYDVLSRVYSNTSIALNISWTVLLKFIDA